ncbi:MULTISPECIES: disulfide bond formation protein DsbD [Pontibacillus]|uniref:Disulfide bond formation protein DsbD n=1 Tax=Pontibacillus chungwhensis TaxID=265426 RepID=A0ABY8V3T1_9BACI|nr:disulfide bond formation protein DsbD [Pontibacillus chungwhensis]MCD5324440.1 disulfide bond formation protein DsbD [Pontibacillus sp. HN14]WIF99265.1 disulfide bond formation protein DsbD [Pontibacillus chungwhensis]
MKSNPFNKIGWLLVLVMGVSWIVVGYSSWFLLLTPMVYISFSIHDGSIKKWKKIKQLSIRQIMLLLFSFVLAVSLVYGLFQLASYIINDVLHLIGGIKTFSVILAIILSLYPVKIAFSSLVYKVTSGLSARSH